MILICGQTYVALTQLKFVVAMAAYTDVGIGSKPAKRIALFLGLEARVRR